jgi:hypothetical protein
VDLLSATTVEAAKPGEYAHPVDFCRLFTEETQSLYLLSLLMTADHRSAEGCFLASFEECVHRASIVLKDGLRTWARHTIIKNSILMLASHQTGNEGRSLTQDVGLLECDSFRKQERDVAISNIFVLEDFERAIYVICVLERYSELTCASLLGCSQSIVTETRVRALQRSVHH